MTNKSLSKGTLINGEYRILYHTSSTYFGECYRVFSSRTNSYADLYVLSCKMPAEKFAKTAEMFTFEEQDFLVTDATPYNKETVSDDLQKADELFKVGVDKNKRKLRLEATEIYEQIYKKYPYIFLSEVTSVNNLACEYLKYYCDDKGCNDFNSYSQDEYNKKACRLYTESAYRGSALAMHMLAGFYEKGICCELNYTMAGFWYKEALGRGHKLSAVKLGDFYSCGYGMEQSYEKAIMYYVLACKESSSACVKLSECYFKGFGVEANDTTGFNYLNEASKLGDKNADIKLADCLMRGKGVEPDFQKADMLIKQSVHKNIDISGAIHTHYLSQGCSRQRKLKGYKYLLLSNLKGVAMYALGLAALGALLVIFMK